MNQSHAGHAKHGALTRPIFEGIARTIDQERRLNRVEIGRIVCPQGILTTLQVTQPVFLLGLAGPGPLAGGG